MIANDFYRQGVVKTSLSLAFVTLLVWVLNISLKGLALL